VYERQTVVNPTNPNPFVESWVSYVGGVRKIHRSEAKCAFSDADTFTQERPDIPKVAPFWWKNV